VLKTANIPVSCDVGLRKLPLSLEFFRRVVVEINMASQGSLQLVCEKAQESADLDLCQLPRSITFTASASTAAREISWPAP